MDMLRGNEIADAGLTDWVKLAQGLHARYRVGSFAEAALLAGDAASQGRGSPGDEVRDGSQRVPTTAGSACRQRRAAPARRWSTTARRPG